MPQKIKIPLSRERRLAPRRNTMIGATIVYNGGQTRLACTVRNISDGGAKLEVSKVQGIPQTFDLEMPGSDHMPCRVVWRALRELGVAFV